jgi:WD40 repeat protein
MAAAPDTRSGRTYLANVDTGIQRLVLRGDELIVGRRFSPDGSKLASGALDGTARVCALNLDRKLTEAECRQYVHGPCSN